MASWMRQAYPCTGAPGETNIALATMFHLLFRNPQDTLPQHGSKVIEKVSLSATVSSL